MVNNIQKLKNIIQEAGAEWVGIQEEDGVPLAVLFNEPETKTTKGLKINEVTVKNVKRKLMEAREKIKKEVNLGYGLIGFIIFLVF